LFLEDRASDVIEPEGSDLIALTQHFTVSQNIAYNKAQRQHDGTVKFEYTSENTPASTVEIPKELKIGIPCFHNGQRYEVRARFRYRLNQGSLKLWYELIEPWRIVEDAFNGVVEEVEELTEQSAYMVKLDSI